MFKWQILSALILLSTSISTLARELVVVSDLDETLRMANVEYKIKAGLKLITGVKSYEGMRPIFNELKTENQKITFYYLSNSYKFLYNGDFWTKRYGFPRGIVLQRKPGDKSESFKTIKLKEIARRHPEADFLLFGDNIEKDPAFYKKFVNETPLKSVSIFIRDARLNLPQDEQIIYYQTEAQLESELDLSPATVSSIRSLPFSKMVPSYLVKNLRKRLIKQCKQEIISCREQADRKVAEVMEQIRP
jgi:phosphatidate phosphatase APP1